MTLHQITEEDLAEMERILPDLMNALAYHLDPRTRTQFDRVRSILSRVRWNYGPPREMERIDP